MKTFDDDFCSFNTSDGVKRIACKILKVQWPPPVEMSINGVSFKRKSHSQITDDQREGMTHVMRGAEYDLVG